MADSRKSHMKSILLPGRRETKARSIARNTVFNQRNVEATSHMPLIEREYGFIRAANNTATPRPSAQKMLDTTSLLTHIRLTQAKIKAARKRLRERAETKEKELSSGSNVTPEPEARIETTCNKLDNPQSSAMIFNLRRKLFDEGEYTITRGQKLSDLHHAVVDFEDMSSSLKRDSHVISFNELEAFCRQMNIRINKGFNPTPS